MLNVRRLCVFSMPKAAVRQRHGVNIPAETPSQHWKRAMFLQFLDFLIHEQARRLVSNNGWFLPSI